MHCSSSPAICLVSATVFLRQRSIAMPGNRPERGNIPQMHSAAPHLQHGWLPVLQASKMQPNVPYLPDA